MSLDDDIARLKIQEEFVQFTHFDEQDAWNLGGAMRAEAVARKLPLVIDLRVAGRKLFYTALGGTVPDNHNWVERKINVVNRLHKCSYRVGRELAKSGKALNEAQGFLPIDYATHGGSFPITIQNVGVVGTITVSGIPQRDDHNFVVEQICKYLKLDYAAIALALE